MYKGGSQEDKDPCLVAISFIFRFAMWTQSNVSINTRYLTEKIPHVYLPVRSCDYALLISTLYRELVALMVDSIAHIITFAAILE